MIIFSTTACHSALEGTTLNILTLKRLHSILWRFSTAGMEGYSSVRLFFGGVSLVKCTLKVLIWYYYELFRGKEGKNMSI